jgi:LysR family transcriptional regulator, glycine cleavage system transcriptional activator
MRKLPPLKSVRVFEAVARHLSFTEAAGELCVTHSAVSQQVKLLEEYFGQKLFERSGRSVALTPQAATYLEDVRTCLDRLAWASEQLASGSSHRVVRVNTTPSMAMKWLIPNLPSFQLANPRVEVRISTSPFDSIEQLDDSHDFILRRDTMARPGYRCRRLLDDEAVVVVSPKMQGIEALTDVKALLPNMLLHLRSRPQAWPRWFELAGLPRAHSTGGRFFDHYFLSLEAAINGMGVVLAPEVLVEEDLRLGRLTKLFTQYVLRGPGFHVLARESGPDKPHLAAFMDWLQGRAAASARGS